ncbi:uncharacterized protein BDZ99DRAFT_461034 [Mytilinidion resinicola]|uniref:AD domain-containing protein n=1 Tax=Mytilinidion resinicola TaxID=574789 RepID=A0A6A6YU62_9PEZI|nr:uncharacterized protein BDZ99DRAFT_461034 [Mytilinidion resinicola]KAF2812300.1 hypothetical protein BDZ99DRAFT_461034 [Mytilinidion resinicola]
MEQSDLLALRPEQRNAAVTIKHVGGPAISEFIRYDKIMRQDKGRNDGSPRNENEVHLMASKLAQHAAAALKVSEMQLQNLKQHQHIQALFHGKLLMAKNFINMTRKLLASRDQNAGQPTTESKTDPEQDHHSVSVNTVALLQKAYTLSPEDKAILLDISNAELNMLPESQWVRVMVLRGIITKMDEAPTDTEAERTGSFVAEPTESFVAEPTESFVAEPTGSFVAEPTGSFVAEPTGSFVAEPTRSVVIVGVYVFLEMCKWMPCEWSGEIIVVDDTVFIAPPYTLESCAGVSTKPIVVAYVKARLEEILEALNEVSLN